MKRQSYNTSISKILGLSLLIFTVLALSFEYSGYYDRLLIWSTIQRGKVPELNRLNVLIVMSNATSNQIDEVIEKLMSSSKDHVDQLAIPHAHGVAKFHRDYRFVPYIQKYALSQNKNIGWRKAAMKYIVDISDTNGVAVLTLISCRTNDVLAEYAESLLRNIESKKISNIGVVSNNSLGGK